MESNSKNVTYVYDTVVLSDGRILDLARSDQGNLKVIVHNENRNEVYDQVWYGNTYQPASLDPDVRGAVRFPDSAKPYENAATLLAKLSQLCAKQYGLSPLSASVVAVWLLTTWMSEAFTAPPTLLVNASCTGDVMRFFKLLQALCRRGLIVNELSFHLPLFLAPTLLVLEPGLSEKMRARWFLSAYRGVFVPKANGGLRQVVCSKAVHSGVTQSGTSWGDETLEVSLLPSHAFPKASKSELDAIAAEFQPKMQLLRFHYLERKPAASNGKVPSELAGSVLATELFSLLGNRCSF